MLFRSLKWLQALIDLQTVWDGFSSWRAYYRYKRHVTSQHKSLQGHLTRLFGPGIKVRSYDDELLDVGLDSEPAHWVVFAPYQELALSGEGGQSFGGKDFIVYIPPTVNIEVVKAEIEKYKLADKTYKIIER